jgi:hypothetical protein
MLVQAYPRAGESMVAFPLSADARESCLPQSDPVGNTHVPASRLVGQGAAHQNPIAITRLLHHLGHDFFHRPPPD